MRLDEVRGARAARASRAEARAVYEASIEASLERLPRAHRRGSTPVTRGDPLRPVAARPARKPVAFGKSVAREAEKKAIETARYVIPIACHTAMVYTISGLVLHRLRRMVAASATRPTRRATWSARMVAEVDAARSLLLRAGRRARRSTDAVLENRARRRRASATPRALEAFDKSLGGRTRAARRLGRARARRWSRTRCATCSAAPISTTPRRSRWRSIPAKNPYRLETLNVSTHSPLMRALAHAHYTFRKKLSHTADSQDQRHRTVPGSRPLLSRSVPGARRRGRAGADPRGSGLPRALRGGGRGGLGCARARCSRCGVAPELALYVLPNALAVRFEESGALLDLLHKWTMRTCLNAQREIWQASMDEIEEVRAVHPELVRHVGPPCFVRTGWCGRAAPRARTSAASPSGAISRARSGGSDASPRGARLRCCCRSHAVASARAADSRIAWSGPGTCSSTTRTPTRPNADAPRWDDRVWVFEKKGDRLAWTEYPIVGLHGRAAAASSGATAASSRACSATGSRARRSSRRSRRASSVNPRGMKAKTLRNTRGGWQSASRPTAASASVVTYTEAWSIEGTPDAAGLPARGFARRRAHGIARGADALHDDQRRPGRRRGSRAASIATARRKGSFRMLRAGTGKALTTNARPSRERQSEAFMRGDEPARRARRELSSREAGSRRHRRRLIRAAIDERMRSALDRSRAALGPDRHARAADREEAAVGEAHARRDSRAGQEAVVAP